MNPVVRLVLIAVLMVVVLPAYAAADSHAGVSVAIDWHPDTAPQPEGALWLAYLAARSAYIGEHPAEYGWQPGVVTPSFQEELAARTQVARAYRESRQKDRPLKLAYFEDLAVVAESSFLAEYVWTYLHQGGWGAPPEGLRLVEFMGWRAQHLAQHQVMTKGQVRFEAKGQAGATTPGPMASEAPTLAQGRKAVERGESALAIAAFFDPVLEHFSRIYRDSGKRLYCARSQTQALIYLVLPSQDKRPVEVLDSTWSDAYLMKAYALTEMRQLRDAQAALDKAIELSPMNAQYLSERAYAYQAQGQCDRSIAAYREAETAAQQASEAATQTADLTRAWRGQGYCLVEQGRLDEAEALYRKCLELDPADSKAKGELEYIRQKRGTQPSERTGQPTGQQTGR